MVSEAGAAPSNDPISATRMLFRNDSISPVGGILDCGYIRRGSGVPGGSRVLGRYAFVYLVTGRGEYRDRAVRSCISAGDFILLMPDEPHWYGPSEPGQAFDTLHAIFDGPAFRSWIADGIEQHGSPVWQLHPVQYWLRTIEESLGTGNHGSRSEGVAECIALQQLLHTIVFASQQEDPDVQWLQRAKKRLLATRDESLAARELGFSREGFRKRFKRIHRTTPTRFMWAQTIDDVCQLLATTTHSLREIARLTGFSDEFHLSRRFKESVGVPPSEYRRRYR